MLVPSQWGSGFESVNALSIRQELYQLSKGVISGGYSDELWQAAQSSMHEALIPGQLIQLTWSGKNRMRETSLPAASKTNVPCLHPFEDVTQTNKAP